ncbi:Toluene-4-monooxygenase system protein A (plasmid) [Mycobacterium sp. THAF192]|nr:Toluene-4-monooxygenase system protein A [Mycobacterium sp. THAF192]
MPLLERGEWYDLARQTNWTPVTVSEEEMFPPEMSDTFGLPMKEWESYDEPYKVSYREYVSIQREKDSGAYSVKAALQRSKYYENADPAYLSLLKMHYGMMAVNEYQTAFAMARMARFGKAPGMRNMATFGVLDECRHGQIQLSFPHQLVSLDRQFDWTHQAHRSANWSIIAANHANEDVMLTRDAVSVSIGLNFAFETGLTNVQMIGLAADAANMGDYTFANLITSIQSDESRHAQIATPLIETLLRNGKKAEVQQVVDVAFWRVWRTFALLTGVPMDYWFPLEKRDQSFKEYMREFVAVQFAEQLQDAGLDLPWYWDYFLADIDTSHHSIQAVMWSMRDTIFWNPTGGVGPEERAWLEDKYPGWNATFGKYWDLVADNLAAGREDLTKAIGMPALCNMCQTAISGLSEQIHQKHWNGRMFNFCSPVCQWIFDLEPSRYADFRSITDRLHDGEITPETLLPYMGIGVLSDGGRDAHDYAWATAPSTQDEEISA